ncbi:hypothetical protein GCM10010106_47810 [Thermopolyspora flexuosa]|nr:hypothetical protein GCM10010106_47810 [Thermopolyspora flexuosa]
MRSNGGSWYGRSLGAKNGFSATASGSSPRAAYQDAADRARRKRRIRGVRTRPTGLPAFVLVLGAKLGYPFERRERPTGREQWGMG